MRTTGMLVLAIAAAACKPKPEPSGPTEPGPGSGSAAVEPEPVVASPAKPLPPIRGLDEPLIALLGLDQQGAPATVDAEAAARFAVLSSRAGTDELVIYGFFNGALAAEHTVALPTGDAAPRLKDWAWRTEEELVLLLTDGTLRTFNINDGKLKPLARPNKKLFAVKKPGGAVERFDRDERLIATAGEVWLQHCVWGERGDEDPCTTGVYVQVAPKAKASPKAPTARAPWRNDPVPGWQLAVEPLPDQPTGALRCRGPGGAVRGDLPVPPDSFGYSDAEQAVWLSAQPPIALVKLWFGGADGAVSADRFLARCKTSDAEPLRVEVGPSWFWTLGTRGDDGASDGGSLLLWHGRVVGRLPSAAQVLFAP